MLMMAAVGVEVKMNRIVVPGQTQALLGLGTFPFSSAGFSFNPVLGSPYSAVQRVATMCFEAFPPPSPPPLPPPLRPAPLAPLAARGCMQENRRVHTFIMLTHRWASVYLTSWLAAVISIDKRRRV